MLSHSSHIYLSGKETWVSNDMNICAWEKESPTHCGCVGLIFLPGCPGRDSPAAEQCRRQQCCLPYAFLHAAKLQQTQKEKEKDWYNHRHANCLVSAYIPKRLHCGYYVLFKSEMDTLFYLLGGEKNTSIRSIIFFTFLACDSTIWTKKKALQCMSCLLWVTGQTHKLLALRCRFDLLLTACAGGFLQMQVSL